MRALLIALAVLVPGPALGEAVDVPVPFLEWEVVSRRPHDPTAFTQGLLFDDAGRLYESTGQRGESTIREIDPLDGRVLRSRALPESWFGEGLELVGDELIQLTYTAGIALRWDAGSLERVGAHTYDGEGWGLCHEGDRLVMSNGSNELTFRDPGTFEPLGSVAVTVDGEPLDQLNELECVNGDVWANVWKTDVIVRIDPADGAVTGLLDLSGILEPHPAEGRPGAVLNGIAYDGEAGTFLVTGKYWPEMIEIVVRELEP